MPLHDSFKRNPLQKRANERILENMNLATPPSRKDLAFVVARALEMAPETEKVQWKSSSGATYQLQVCYQGDIPTWNLLKVDDTPPTLLWRMVTENPELVYRMLLRKASPQGDFAKTGSQLPAVQGESGAALSPQPIGVGSMFLDRYRITDIVAKGGMGVVYKATDTVMDRDVAVKLLHSHLMEDAKSKQRFDNEMSICLNFKHPNVVSVFDYGYSPEQVPYMVMEYLDGLTLDQKMREDGPLPFNLFITLFVQVCSALHHAHVKQFVHRDVKPRNIVLIPLTDGDYLVKLVDFGIAKIIGGSESTLQKLTQTGDAVGSPFYMSPEQCRSQEMDSRSDIYSLGCVMYESISGKLPFNGPNAISTLFMHINDRAEPFSAWLPGLNIPNQLERIILKTLEKDPADRYQSVMDLSAELQSVAKSFPNLSKGVHFTTASGQFEAYVPDPEESLREQAEVPEAADLVTGNSDSSTFRLTLELLIQARIITAEDAKAAMTLHDWNGGDPVQYLVEFGCINSLTHLSALQAVDMMARYSLKVEDAACTLKYCQKKGITIEDALREFGESSGS
jgi:serine/threonine protein kinase